MNLRFITLASVTLVVLLTATSHTYAVDTKVERINFKNNTHYRGSKLREIIHSQGGKIYEPRFAKLDRLLLRNFYKGQGYLDASVQNKEVYNKDRSRVRLTYSITEGRRYYYGGLRLSGVQSIQPNKINNQFDLEKNAPFNERLITGSLKQVENLYYNSGKPFAEIKINYLYESDSLIYVLLDVTENETVFIEDIEYKGLQLVQKFLVRRELEIKKGDLYNRQAIETSQRNIYGLGLFRYVRFEIEPIPDKPAKVVLKINVQEKDPRWLGLRLGLAHEQEVYYGNKIEFTAEGGHRNIYGTGRSISLHITPAISYDFGENQFHNPDNRISLRFIEPWIFYTRMPGIFELAYQQFRPLNSGDFDVLSASFDVTREISPIMEVSASIGTKRVNRVSDDAIEERYVREFGINESQVYSVVLYGKRDNRKNVFNPVNSSYHDLSLSFSYSEGRDEEENIKTNQYITLISSWQRYQPWRPKLFNFRRWGFTLATRIKAGAIIETGKNKEIPINDRFYAGGANTVRGYSEQLLGPASAYNQQGIKTQASGGKLLYLANAEVRIPLFWIFVLEYFVDSGFVWPELSVFDARDVKFTTGMGLAVLTPLGPARIDYGRKLMPQPDDPSKDAIHFGLYFAF
ncbi:MAG: BamA/TamA family outer membrane protein [Caldithrix sp.]|nr:BamA/TamA family outer membrane protein [Caldithrix sp.]